MSELPFNSVGLEFPKGRIIVNLAPADYAKEGTHYDLPIIMGILISKNIIPAEETDSFIFMGELSLDGGLNPVNGVLPAAIHAQSERRGLICPAANANEALWSGNKNILAPTQLMEIVNHFKGRQLLSQPSHNRIVENKITYPDLKDVKGQHSAKRALEIAASGGHNMLMVGPPGSGKSMLASRLPGIVPDMDVKEMLENTMIASISGNLPAGRIKQARPYRDPHHSASMVSIVGGGKTPRPGEITLAHNGVMFLDELPEFPRNVLESLRQPIETGKITVSRAQAHVTFPANFQLIAAMNPCKCGYLGDQSKSCNKAPICGIDYQSKLSGPLLDRIDLHIEVPAITPNDLEKHSEEESSNIVAQRVTKVRQVQKTRYQHHKIRTNSEADGELLRKVATPDEKGKNLLQNAHKSFNLSMRAYNRILRLSRTIADMEGSETVKHNHIAESLSYRLRGIGK